MVPDRPPLSGGFLFWIGIPGLLLAGLLIAIGVINDSTGPLVAGIAFGAAAQVVLMVGAAGVGARMAIRHTDWERRQSVP